MFSFTVEVLPKAEQHPIVEEVLYDGADPVSWTDRDVQQVIKLMLLAFDRVANPEAADDGRGVALRGLSWVVTPHEGDGVVIAIEIPSGAVAAGPFEIDAGRLDAMVRQALSGPSAPGTGTVH